MVTKAVKLKLTFNELDAFNNWLMGIMQHSTELAGQSIYLRIQLTILGDLLQKRVYPKTLVNAGDRHSLKLQPVEWMAIQAAIYQGWNYSYDNYTQNVIRHLVIHKLPKLPRLDNEYLAAPDQWEES